MIKEDFEVTEKLRYKGKAEATAEEKAAVGGEKTLQIENIFFQSDIDAQDKADSLLTRLKSEKKYNEVTTEFCPAPVERRDTVRVQEFITDDKSIWHVGFVRHVKLSVTPTNQSLTLILEE